MALRDKLADRAVIVLDAGGEIQLDQKYYVHERFHKDVRAAQTGPV